MAEICSRCHTRKRAMNWPYCSECYKSFAREKRAHRGEYDDEDHYDQFLEKEYFTDDGDFKDVDAEEEFDQEVWRDITGRGGV